MARAFASIFHFAQNMLDRRASSNLLYSSSLVLRKQKFCLFSITQQNCIFPSAKECCHELLQGCLVLRSHDFHEGVHGEQAGAKVDGAHGQPGGNDGADG